MATTRVISLSPELNNLLKQEANASSLISQLLQDHYNNKETDIKETNVDVFEVMRVSDLKIRNEEATRKLREAVLEEEARQESEQLQSNNEEEELDKIFE